MKKRRFGLALLLVLAALLLPGAASCGLFLADSAWTPLCEGWHLS